MATNQPCCLTYFLLPIPLLFASPFTIAENAVSMRIKFNGNCSAGKNKYHRNQIEMFCGFVWFIVSQLNSANVIISYWIVFYFSYLMFAMNH